MPSFTELLNTAVGEDFSAYVASPNFPKPLVFSPQVHPQGPPRSNQAPIQAWRQLSENLAVQADQHRTALAALPESFFGNTANVVANDVNAFVDEYAAMSDAANVIPGRIFLADLAFAEMQGKVAKPDQVQRNRDELVECETQLARAKQGAEALAGQVPALETERAGLITEYAQWDECNRAALTAYSNDIAAATGDLPPFEPWPAVNGDEQAGRSWPQLLLDGMNDLSRWAFSRPLIGNGTDGVAGQNGEAGGLLWGSGGKAGGDGARGGNAGLLGHGGTGGLHGHGGNGGWLWGSGGNSDTGTGGHAWLFGNGGDGVTAGKSGLLIGKGGNATGDQQAGANGGLLCGRGGDSTHGPAGHAWLIGDGGDGVTAGKSGLLIGKGGNATGNQQAGANGGLFYGRGGKGGTGGDGGRAWLIGGGGDGGDADGVGGDGGNAGLLFGDGGAGGKAQGDDSYGGDGGNAGLLYGNRGHGGDGGAAGADGRNGLFHRSYREYNADD